MSAMILNPGTLVEIEPVGQDAELPVRFSGRVADTTSETLLSITFVGRIPRLGLALQSGDEVEIRIALTEGIYRFTSPVVERTEAGLEVAYPFDILRLQRRERRRVPAEGKATFTLQDHANARASYGALVDLSTGGLQLQAEKWLPVEAKVKVEFEVPGELTAEADCIIRWKKAAGVNSAGTRIFNYGLQFLKIHERTLQRLRQFILRREREMPDG